MTLKESYLSNLKNLPKEATKLNVTRTAGHLLSPSTKLRMMYKDNVITWNTFTKLYKQEMNNDKCKAMMLEIKNLAESKDVYLLCFEKTGNCHRHILLELIEHMCRWCGNKKEVSTGLCERCCRF
jgi:uncharacterized protein YeaO (DUF488 family)